MRKKYETIIIGGGISGLACARKLHDAKKDFLIITKKLGGRMLASKDFAINYGAAYVTEDYKNVLRYVDKIEPLTMKDCYFLDGKGGLENLSFVHKLKYLRTIRKLTFLIKKFRRHMLKFRAQAPHKTFKEILEQDAFFLKYWKMPACEFVKQNKLEKLDNLYLDPIVSTTAFFESKKLNVIYYLGMLLPMILQTWVVSFKNTISKLTKGFKGKIRVGCARRMRRNENSEFEIKTSLGNFTAKNVVLAAPEKNLKNLYKLPKPRAQNDVYVFHVVGERKDFYKNKKALIFHLRNGISMIWRQKNGEEIIYSRKAKPNFKKYFKKCRIKKRIFWQPAMIVPNGGFVKQKLEKNLYLASDYNISGLEEGFLSGVYAANQIIAAATSSE